MSDSAVPLPLGGTCLPVWEPLITAKIYFYDQVDYFGRMELLFRMMIMKDILIITLET